MLVEAAANMPNLGIKKKFKTKFIIAQIAVKAKLSHCLFLAMNK